MEFQRIGDQAYFFVQRDKSGEDDVFLDYSQSGLACADQRYISLWMANHPITQTPVLLDYKGEIYKLTSCEQSLTQPIMKAIGEATNFFRDTHKGQKKSYKVEAISHVDRMSLKFLKVISVEGAPRATVALPDVVTQKSTEERAAFEAYSDPYSLLAEKAFQQGLEARYWARDVPRESDTCYYFDPRSNELTLVARGELKKVKASLPTAIRDAMNRYRAFLASEYGEEKLLYMEHLLGINLHEMAVKNSPLTPEIVYQFNMATSLHEIQEVRNLFCTLEKACHEAPTKNLVKVLETKIGLLELRGLVKLLGKSVDQLTIQELQKWVKRAKESQKEIERTMDIYALDSVAQERMYSGRKIFESIATDYTTAEYGKRKIYIDLQELAQLSQEHAYDEARPITDKQREAAFYERLAHVVSKKMLVHSHPQNGLQIGMLIPARPDKEGNKQWYVVSGCTRTPYGKCSYTLEPASPTSTLPRILLHRSTFSTTDPSSTRNDLNPLSGPGYEGYELAAKYEDAFVDSCTIPSWVGYALWAEQAGDDGEKKRRLKLANSQLILALKMPLRPLSYAQLIRKYDYLLMDILYATLWTLELSVSEKAQLFAILSSFSQQEAIDKKTEGENAKFLAKLLDMFPSKHTGHAAKLFRDFAEGSTKDLSQQVEDYEIAKQLAQLEKEGDAEKWLQALFNHAKSQNEHPSQKSRQSVAIVGHSLGGALGQISFERYSAQKERIPLATMKLWTFDAPGILDQDCQAFIDFGNKHSQMLQALGSKFAINSSQEEGDIAVLFGERHLGSAKNSTEETETKPWLTYENHLYEVKADTKTRALRDSPSVHATRLQTRTSDAEVIIHEISPLKQYQFDMAEGPSEWERFSKLWKLLPNTPLNSLTPKEAEAVRKKIGMPLRAIRPSFMEDAQVKSIYDTNGDANGVFAINTKGLCTR